ncbi:MAG: c-type cytochrome [Planctomycetia bacterium]|nr:c-type cytochrome [Planctomycetia bacterium]
MPATESTWRDIKWMHMVFGVSSIAMLLATIWMFVDDHNREWRDYQEFYYTKLQVWDGQSRQRELDSENFEGRKAELENLLAAEANAVPRKTLARLLLAEALKRQLVESGASAGDAAKRAPVEEHSGKYSALAEPALRYLQAAAAAAEGQAQGLIQADSVSEAESKARQDRLAAAEAELAPLLAAFVTQAQQETGGPGRSAAHANELYEKLQGKQDANAVAKYRAAVDDLVAAARFEEDNLNRDLRFAKADLDVARSEFDLRTSDARMAQLQAAVDRLLAKVAALTLQYESASSYRKGLEAVVRTMRTGEAVVKKELDEHVTDYNRLTTQIEKNEPNFLKSIVLLPILDAFSKSGDIKPDQDHLPELPVDFRHAQVARFDRCIMCHLSIDLVAPGLAGAAGEPKYASEHVLKEPLSLATPKEAPKIAAEASDQEKDHLLFEVYGLQLAAEGLFDPGDVMIDFIRARSPAAEAMLKKGDVLLVINKNKVTDHKTAVTYLLERVTWGQPLLLTVRRGVPQPYGGHPRLDLYMTSTSPHPRQKFGCTICHDGQGNATEFKWISHTPDSLAQQDDWAARHGWFNNHFWEYPMKPGRFTESNCLKCHYDLTELEPSDRFPDPPAPKLSRGYEIVRTYGCFGCHEITGYDGPTKRIGPDLRLEPNYAAAALALYVDPRLPSHAKEARYGDLYGPNVAVSDGAPTDEALAKFDGQLQGFVNDVLKNPGASGPRARLIELIDADAGSKGAPPRLRSQHHKLAAVLADVEVPGQQRRVGPSLRHVAEKVDAAFLFDWLLNPRNFRPSTRMPRFFGQHRHLEVAAMNHNGHAAAATPPAPPSEGGDRPAKAAAPAEPGHTQHLEQAEILGAVAYLLSASHPLSHVDESQGITLSPSAERGKRLFQTRGCLACHTHQDFPDAKQTQGPDLSRVGLKLNTPKGAKWLYTWLRNPSHYSARTKMPDLFLEPIVEQKREEDKIVDVGVSDAAADIREYLLASKGTSEGSGKYEPQPLPDLTADDVRQAIDEIALEHLRATFTLSQAQKYLASGIPEEMAGELKGDEVELLGANRNDDERQHKVLRFVGRRTLSKYGCFGCHDIPGFEGNKPIGTNLADWGKKDPGRMAFESIDRFIHATVGQNGRDLSIEEIAKRQQEGEHHELDLREFPTAEQDKAYLLTALMSHHREGFLFQKLREPRSFDYEKTQNKKYNERLRMPQFPFQGHEEIESVMTFVLGLLSDPAPEKYQYRPPERQKAIVEGRKVLERFNCGGCHLLRNESYEFDFPTTYPDFAADKEFPADEYPFLEPHFSPQELARSAATDNRGRATVRVVGSKVFDTVTGEVSEETEDDDGRKIYYLRPVKPVAINGKVFTTSDQLPMPVEWLRKYHPPEGGSLAQMLPPALLARQKEFDPASNFKYTDAMGWAPPPLVGEGCKVQPQWLHSFLLSPYRIRPAARLRMPKFNLSQQEASALVNYFAAVDNERYPFEHDERTTPEHLALLDQRIPDRLTDAMKIVANKEKCVKCHQMGDFAPTGSVLAMAPRLDRVHDRLRPEYLRRWIANPPRVLFYTGMPVNVKVAEPIRPKDFKVVPGKFEVGKLVQEGTATQQVDALADLLLNFPAHMQEQQSIVPLINESPTPTPAPGTTTTGTTTTGTTTTGSP